MGIAAELRMELKQIPAGWGVHKANCVQWIGPELQRILRLDGSLTDAVCRQRLIDLLMKETARLPEPLRLLYRIASGISSDERFLAERLLRAEPLFQRESKTLTRRLRRAEELMAAGIAARYPRPSGPYSDQGWHWEEYRADLDLGAPHPTVTMRRHIRALDDGQEVIREVFAVPRSAIGRTIGITALEGCTLTGVTQTSPSTWIATFQLDQALRVGHVTQTVVRVTFESLDCLRPYLVMAPLRPCSRYEVTVRVGRPSAAALIWTIDGATTTSLDDQHPAADASRPEPDSVHSATFTNLMNGLAYGLGWVWADPAS
ncbi:MAG: hypothetical protein QM624_18995 [Micropruina sp.]